MLRPLDLIRVEQEAIEGAQAGENKRKFMIHKDHSALVHRMMGRVMEDGEDGEEERKFKSPQ